MGTSRHLPPAEAVCRYDAPAYSVVEVLVTLAIVTALASIGIVSLSAMRERARSAVTFSDLSSHARVFATYTLTHQGAFPYFTRVGAFSTSLAGGGVTVGSINYFDAHETWHIALTDAYYNLKASHPMFHPRRGGAVSPPGYPSRTTYHYACVFIAHPEFWDQRKRTGPEQFRATYAEDVTFPAFKAVMVTLASSEEVETLGARIGHPSAFVDGSARTISWQHRNEGYPRGEGYIFQNAGAVHFGDGPPLLHTINGVRGRDVR